MARGGGQEGGGAPSSDREMPLAAPKGNLGFPGTRAPPTSCRWENRCFHPERSESWAGARPWRSAGLPHYPNKPVALNKGGRGSSPRDPGPRLRVTALIGKPGHVQPPSAMSPSPQHRPGTEGGREDGDKEGSREVTFSRLPFGKTPVQMERKAALDPQVAQAKRHWAFQP